ncbi:MAG TPA: hypothetical protein VF618_17400 [Thermoanaerobaculia bacterium]
MTTVPHPHPRPLSRPALSRPVVHAPLFRLDGPRILFLTLVVAAAIAVVAVRPAMRYVLAPMLATLLMLCGYLVAIYRQDKTLPVFEASTYWMLAATLYGAFPLLNFIAGGLRWYPLSDSRLVMLDPGPVEVGTMGWRYVVHIASFLAVYLAMRRPVKMPPMQPPGRSRIAAIVIGLIASTAIIVAVGQIFGVTYFASYKDLVKGTVKGYADVSSLPVLQVVHNLVGMRMLLIQATIGILLLSWRKLSSKVILGGFFLFLGSMTVALGTARSDFVLMLMTAIMLYHRIVKPIRFIIAIPAGIFFICGFLFMGIMRDMQGVHTISVEYETPVLASMNEFQVVFATAYDLQQMRDSGELEAIGIPWQLPFCDFYFLIPSQLLPFQKIDPSGWYLYIRGIEGVGLMFGVVAQAAVGWGWLELILRAVGVALFCAFLQRWYAKHVRGFWPTIFLAFMCMWMYYSLRQSSFSFMYFIVYRFMPAFLAVETVAWVLRDGRRRLLKGRRTS